MSVTCVTCIILLKNMQKHSVVWGVTCRVTCVTCWFLDVKVFSGEKSTWNLESHKFLSQVLASVRPVTVYCYWESCKPVRLVSAKNKDCSTEIWRINKYYSLAWRTSKAQFNHSPLHRSLHISYGNAHESLPCRFVLSKKRFCF